MLLNNSNRNTFNDKPHIFNVWDMKNASDCKFNWFIYSIYPSTKKPNNPCYINIFI